MLNKKERLTELYAQFTDFTTSPLYISGAQSIVFGEGNSASPIIFVGEAPGAEEDAQARPFVGRAGRLLTQTIESYNVKRGSVFITNIVKCRPPHNRVPTSQEVLNGKNLILLHEIAIIEPKLIVTLGASALNGLYETTTSITKIRGKVLSSIYGKILPIYHPAYILRNPAHFDSFNKDIEYALSYVNLI